jgi:hypothetical protein
MKKEWVSSMYATFSSIVSETWLSKREYRTSGSPSSVSPKSAYDASEEPSDAADECCSGG